MGRQADSDERPQRMQSQRRTPRTDTPKFTDASFAELAAAIARPRGIAISVRDIGAGPDPTAPIPSAAPGVETRSSRARTAGVILLGYGGGEPDG